MPGGGGMGAQIPLLPGVPLAPSFLENLPSNADASHPNLTRHSALGTVKTRLEIGRDNPWPTARTEEIYPSCHASRAGIRPLQALRGIARVNPSGQPKGRRGGEGGAVVKATARSVPDRTIAQAAQGGVVQPNQARPSPASSSFSSPPARLERGAGARQAASESEPADRRKRGRGGSRDRRRQESQLGGRPPSSRPPRLGDKGGERRQESSEDRLARRAEHDAA